MFTDSEIKKKLHLTPRQILTNAYILELAENGIKTDEQIEAHLKEELLSKGIILK